MSYASQYRGLPRELRDQIYENLLCPPDGLIIAHASKIPRYRQKRAQLPMVQFPACAYIDQSNRYPKNQFPYPRPRLRYSSRRFLRDAVGRSRFRGPFPDKPKVKNPIDISIFLANREVFAEASSMFYQNIRLVFHDMYPEGCVRFLKRLPRAVLPRIRILHQTLLHVLHSRTRNLVAFTEERMDLEELSLPMTFILTPPYMSCPLIGGICPGLLGTLRTMLLASTSLQKVRIQCSVHLTSGGQRDRTKFINGITLVVKAFHGADVSQIDPCPRFLDGPDTDQPVCEFSSVEHRLDIVDSSPEDMLILTFRRDRIEAGARLARDAVNEGELQKFLGDFCDRWDRRDTSAARREGEA